MTSPRSCFVRSAILKTRRLASASASRSTHSPCSFDKSIGCSSSRMRWPQKPPPISRSLPSKSAQLPSGAPTSLDDEMPPMITSSILSHCEREPGRASPVKSYSGVRKSLEGSVMRRVARRGSEVESVAEVLRVCLICTGGERREKVREEDVEREGGRERESSREEKKGSAAPAGCGRSGRMGTETCETAAVPPC
eukprot:scaffold149530_cov31-Tisochrysis_lutea.AAC.3